MPWNKRNGNQYLDSFVAPGVILALYSGARCTFCWFLRHILYSIVVPKASCLKYMHFGAVFCLNVMWWFQRHSKFYLPVSYLCAIPTWGYKNVHQIFNLNKTNPSGPHLFFEFFYCGKAAETKSNSTKVLKPNAFKSKSKNKSNRYRKLVPLASFHWWNSCILI